MALHSIADRLHPPPADGRPLVQRPGQGGEEIALAIYRLACRTRCTSSSSHREELAATATAPPGLGVLISGVILYEETLFQDAAASSGSGPRVGSILEHFRQQGLVVGIKVVLGVESLAGGLPGETWCPFRQVAGGAARHSRWLPV
jgi:fructose-bisphosphate aldolase class I